VGFSCLILCLQNTVKQQKGDTTVEEGNDVKLSCSLKKISDTSYLYCYRQASRNAPVYILRSISGTDYMSSDFPNRFSSIVNKTSEDFELSIVTVLIRDSAVYHCAMRPHCCRAVAAPYKNSNWLFYR
uniref:Immunoglobulin V-set domain-containing protein n=1 Tax=Callorhinchus milii TaxID=7868 RepID=A0A4W3GFG7_CALMI